MLLLTLLLSGHVLDASTGRPIPGARVTGLPEVVVVMTDLEGYFEVMADSVVVEAWGYETRRLAATAGHIDVWMQPLSVNLPSVEVRTRGPEERAGAAVGSGKAERADGAGGWDGVLATMPGMAATELGAGSFSPSIRGLQGTRIAVVADGVPMQGARWGADHGVLADPELVSATSVVRGGGAVWLGPEAVGGAVRFDDGPPLPEDGMQGRAGTSFRMGDGRAAGWGSAAVRRGRVQVTAGAAVAAFGDRNVEADRFTYNGRVLPLAGNRLVNTSGRTGAAKVGVDLWSQHGGRWRGTLDVFSVQQGIFPGIIGTPLESDLEGDGDPRATELPRSEGSRVTIGAERDGADGSLFRLSAAVLQRREWAPPHAHGWGPEPDTPLALHIEERTAFAEVRTPERRGVRLGAQVEGLLGATAGWEFLLADHRAGRASVGATWVSGGWSAGVRADAVHRSGARHEEPLYGPEGEVLGVDVRAATYRRWMAGATASLHRSGPNTHATLAVSTKFPDPYQLGADGIHHGTFRYERGNATLRPEHVAELQLGSVARWGRLTFTADAFAAVHDRFIHLRPTGAFAPVSHAGQVYVFAATPAFRSGGEAEATWRFGRRGNELQCGAWWSPGWDLASGLGLPFTPPPRVRLTGVLGERRLGSARVVASLGVERIGRAELTARNEEATPGATLVTAAAEVRRGFWTLRVSGANLTRAAYLDHTSAYRALGLPAQDRTVTVRLARAFSNITSDVEINSKPKQ